MRTVFADSLYWIAIVRPNDPWKVVARAARGAARDLRIITTDEVLTEFLAALSASGEAMRHQAARMVRAILSNRNVEVIPQSRGWQVVYTREAQKDAKRMALRWLSIAFTFFVAYSTVQAQTAPQLAQRTFPSVVMIVTSDASGQPLALGSGFAVRGGVIATNMHVIEGASAARAKVIGRPETYAVGGIVGTDATADLALLKVVGLDAPPLQLGDNKQAAVGDQVFAVGNPEGLEGTFSEGIVSGIRKIDLDELLQITAPISPGSSGGPVIDSTGRVLGIAVATFKEGQNLNFAVPVSYLKALLARSAGAAVTPLAASARQGANNSIVAHMGDTDTVGVTGGKFLWEYPLSGFADYSFTLTNHLERPVEDVYGLVIFYAQDETVLDAEEFRYSGVIPPGLGRRETGKADSSIREMTTTHDQFGNSALTPSTRVQLRILNFEVSP